MNQKIEEEALFNVNTLLLSNFPEVFNDTPFYSCKIEEGVTVSSKLNYKLTVRILTLYFLPSRLTQKYTDKMVNRYPVRFLGYLKNYIWGNFNFDIIEIKL